MKALGPCVAKISRSSARIAAVFGRSSAATLAIPGQSVLVMAYVEKQIVETQADAIQLNEVPVRFAPDVGEVCAPQINLFRG